MPSKKYTDKKPHAHSHPNVDFLIKKESGEKEKYDGQKLCSSMIKAGAPRSLAENICERVEQDLAPGITSGKIWRTALRYLVKEDLSVSARYGVRRGMSGLGPTGFVFEKFVETLLQAYGYQTKTNQMVIGASGLQHEIDILAKKGNRVCYIEAKYKNKHGLRTHVNDVMYSYARFLDIAEKHELKEKKRKNRSSKNSKASQNKKKYEIWMVTNTEFTSSSQIFAEYNKMKLIGWDYPKERSLEDMIAQKKVYPITILPSVTMADRKVFMRAGLMLAQDLIPHDVDDLVRSFNIDRKRAHKIMREVEVLLK